MFSEALRILDENTAHYMIEEMQQEIDSLKTGVAEKDAVIAKKDSALANQASVIADQAALIEQLKAQLNSTK